MREPTEYLSVLFLSSDSMVRGERSDVADESGLFYGWELREGGIC